MSDPEIFGLIEAHGYRGQGRGQWAWRYPSECPPVDAPEGALWPQKPKWTWRATMWIKEHWLAILRRKGDAEAYRATRTLWCRNPWLRTGGVWWRPMGALRYEFIDSISGFHRWDVERLAHTWEFSSEQWHDARRAVEKGQPQQPRTVPLEVWRISDDAD